MHESKANGPSVDHLEDIWPYLSPWRRRTFRIRAQTRIVVNRIWKICNRATQRFFALPLPIKLLVLHGFVMGFFLSMFPPPSRMNIQFLDLLIAALGSYCFTLAVLLYVRPRKKKPAGHWLK